MVNILIVDDNLEFCKNLINDLTNNTDVRICKICTNGLEALEILNKEDIDIILLDIIMPLCNGIKVLNILKNQRNLKYQHSIIIISGEISFISQFSDEPLVYDYILKGTNNNKIIEKVNRLIEAKDTILKRHTILHELIKISYDINHKGTTYLLETIMQIYLSKETMNDNLQTHVYPIVSKMYNRTVHNIKCNINNATYSMYYNCNINLLKSYFNFNEDIKPTVKTVIYTILNKIA